MTELPLGYCVYQYDDVTSTNIIAKDFAESGAEDGTVIIANSQSDGRGKKDRIWFSPKGNLYTSIIIKKYKLLSQLPFLAAISVGITIQSLLPNIKIEYKWPNDVLVNGKKIAGILIETKTSTTGVIDWVIVGIGVNVVQSLEGIGISLADCQYNIENFELLKKILINFDKMRQLWLNYGFENIRDIWLQSACFLNQVIDVSIYNKTYTGYFRGINLNGQIILYQQQDDKYLYLDTGEIFKTNN